MAVYGPVHILPYDPQCHELIAMCFTVGLDRLYKIRKKYRCVPNVISHILLSQVAWKAKIAEDDIAFLLNRGELVELISLFHHKML
jgi:hypothetical protein